MTLNGLRRLSGQLHKGTVQLELRKSDRLNVSSSAQTSPPIFQTVSTRQNLLSLLLALTLCHDLPNACLTGFVWDSFAERCFVAFACRPPSALCTSGGHSPTKAAT